MVGAEEGLYQLDAAGLSAISPAEGGETSVIRVIVDAGNGEWLIATWAGLYPLNAACMIALQQAGDPVLTELREVVDAGDGVRLIGTNIGLYRLDGAGLSELLPAEGSEAGIIMEIVAAGNGVWDIGSDALYRLNPPSLPTSENATRDDARNDEDHTFAWLIEHPCVSALPNADLVVGSLSLLSLARFPPGRRKGGRPSAPAERGRARAPPRGRRYPGRPSRVELADMIPCADARRIIAAGPPRGPSP